MLVRRRRLGVISGDDDDDDDDVDVTLDDDRREPAPAPAAVMAPTGGCVLA